jgi:LmbE family N-acetylglucosaminyl deacetylase
MDSRGSNRVTFRRRFYLSPHLDDAVLSCGGTVARQVLAGEWVTVVTVFAGDPGPAPLSSFAQRTHQAWGDPPRPYAVRRAEDRAALQRLGAGLLHLGFREAIYRHDRQGEFLYTSDEALFGPPHPADDGVVDRLEAALRPAVCRLDPTMLYVPLGVGRHVDHQLVGRAARRLLSPPETAPQVWWYEDLPYATGLFPPHDPDTVEQALARWGGDGWTASDEAIDLGPKMAAIACYVSQIAPLFGGWAAMRRAIEDYAASLSDVQAYSERFWQPDDEAIR